MKVSVVMSVYNGADQLPSTMDSILRQTEPDFELIVVNDGSSDGSAEILSRYSAQDSRVRVLEQPNTGLTRALARGCAEARAPVIAREDCGDRSHPERLEKQLAAFAEDVVLVSCTDSFFAPGGEVMYVIERDGDAVRRSLLHDDATHLRGLPSHSSATFLKSAYQKAGGYRPQFHFAQDLDLWIRMAALGRLRVVPEVLHEVVFEPGMISGRHRDEQMKSVHFAIRLREAATDAERNALLDEVALIRPSSVPTSPRDTARAYYFIARCLQKQHNPAATNYLRDAIERDPLLWRAWVALASMGLQTLARSLRRAAS